MRTTQSIKNKKMSPSKTAQVTEMMDSTSSPGNRSIYVGNGSTCARAANHSSSQMDPKYVMKVDVDSGSPERRQALRVTVREKV